MREQIYSSDQSNSLPRLGREGGVYGKVLGRIFRAIVKRFDLVSREEFEVQRQVLQRSRMKLANLEQELLEKGDRGS